MRRLVQRLSDIDDRALNAWWGLFIVPLAWLTYRLGYRMRHRGSYIAWDPTDVLLNRGREEGRPLKKR